MPHKSEKSRVALSEVSAALRAQKEKEVDANTD